MEVKDIEKKLDSIDGVSHNLNAALNSVDNHGRCVVDDWVIKDAIKAVAEYKELYRCQRIVIGGQ